MATIRDWLGFGAQTSVLGHGAHAKGGHSDGDSGKGHGHTHGLIDPTLSSSDRGVWAIKWSFIILAITAGLQLVVVLLSSSVALLADMIHNVADATTAIPLWLAFVLARRRPSKVFTYGLGRAEDLAGILIVAIILFSAIVAGYQAINRLLHPQAITHLGWLAAAGLIGFIGNEVVAIFRIRVGRQMNSAALIADGYHARTDGFTSLAVVLGAVGVWFGYPLADPIIGLLITVTILGIVWQSAKAVITRALDGVEPEVTAEIRHAAEHVPGIVNIAEARARWIGHTLHADVAITVDDSLSLPAAMTICRNLKHELFEHIPALRSATVTFEQSPLDKNVRAEGVHESGSHHAPDPFIFTTELAAGTLAIIDTAHGERMQLTLANAVAEVAATVMIDRAPAQSETLVLNSAAEGGASVLTSDVAPGEPHEFTAELRLQVGGRSETLPFRMREPEGHRH